MCILSPLWPISLFLLPLFTLIWSLIVPATSLLPVHALTWNDLSFFLSPPHHTFFMSGVPLLGICSLLSPLASLSLFSVPTSYRVFFMGSQRREDGGPGFGHWCGWARWLCQYPWPAGNSAGSTGSQSGAPSWEEVPDHVWERLLYAREWSANEKDVNDMISKKKTRDDFRIR